MSRYPQGCPVRLLDDNHNSRERVALKRLIYGNNLDDDDELSPDANKPEISRSLLV